jgi:NAD(P)H-hydrate epimerase
LRSLIPVLTSAESSALDAATIAAGVPSRALMQRAGAAAAAQIASLYTKSLDRGALVLAGPGNNGGDGWVVARALAAAGVDVRVISPAGSHSADCIAERDLTIAAAPDIARGADETYSGEGVIIDALLGTGSSGPVREPIASARDIMELGRRHGASIVALDLPSGIDATTGEANDAIRVDSTITFGSFKRGQLVARGSCGTIFVVDIGLSYPEPKIALVDSRWVSANVPRIDASANKGTRKKLVLYGGAPGMSGAVILGLRAALASGIGMVKALVHPESRDVIHAAVPPAIVESWPKAGAKTDDKWADVLVIGPGLGRSEGTRDSVVAAIGRHHGPVLLDADALTAFAGKLDDLRSAIDGRVALITPHPLEMSRLVDLPLETVLARRFDIGAEVAKRIGATVLLKGVPTVVSAPDGKCFVVAAGTPSLATGGSGDLLCGIAGTLLAQMADPAAAAACAAWVHGRASELAGARVRGTTLEDVMEMLPNAWTADRRPTTYPVLAELRAATAE